MSPQRKRASGAGQTVRTVSVGLRARTAKAIAVVVAEGEGGAEVVERCEIPTWDTRAPDSRQPHHAGLGLPEAKAKRRVAAAEAAVRRAAETNLRAFVERLEASGLRASGVAVVGPPCKDPARIGQDHVRAHAAEGQLFRDVLEEAAASLDLPCVRLDERKGYEEAAGRMRCGADALKKQVGELGKPVGPPWRAHEKLACLGALVLLADR